jgi:hypothetical protein
MLRKICEIQNERRAAPRSFGVRAAPRKIERQILRSLAMCFSSSARACAQAQKNLAPRLARAPFPALVGRASLVSRTIDVNVRMTTSPKGRLHNEMSENAIKA